MTRAGDYMYIVALKAMLTQKSLNDGPTLIRCIANISGAGHALNQSCTNIPYYYANEEEERHVNA